MFPSHPNETRSGTLPATRLQATGIRLGLAGVLFIGPSGAGKSLLALDLIDQWTALGQDARLVADDLLTLEATPSGLVMHAPERLAGAIELRGRGIVTRPHLAQAPVHLVVEFVDHFARLLEREELTVELLGQRLARCPVPRAGLIEGRHQALLVREALRDLAPAAENA